MTAAERVTFWLLSVHLNKVSFGLIPQMSQGMLGTVAQTANPPAIPHQRRTLSRAVYFSKFRR